MAKEFFLSEIGPESNFHPGPRESLFAFSPQITENGECESRPLQCALKISSTEADKFLLLQPARDKLARAGRGFSRFCPLRNLRREKTREEEEEEEGAAVKNIFHRGLSLSLETRKPVGDHSGLKSVKRRVAGVARSNRCFRDCIVAPIVTNRWETREITIGRMFSSGFASRGKKGAGAAAR